MFQLRFLLMALVVSLVGCESSEPNQPNPAAEKVQINNNQIHNTMEVKKSAVPPSPELSQSLSVEAVPLSEGLESSLSESLPSFTETSDFTSITTLAPEPAQINPPNPVTTEPPLDINPISNTASDAESQPFVETPPSNPEQLYASCAGCHGAKGGGGVGPEFKGKSPEDLVSKLKAYRAGEQVGPMTLMMAPMALTLSDQDIAVLAEYISQF